MKESKDPQTAKSDRVQLVIILAVFAALAAWRIVTVVAQQFAGRSW